MINLSEIICAARIAANLDAMIGRKCRREEFASVWSPARDRAVRWSATVGCW
jgi:hypothetical protein